MKIQGLGIISDIFTIFHDGEIACCEPNGDALRLEVEIEYLAERINPAFRKFTIQLYGVEDLRFQTWPRDPQSHPEILRDLKVISKSELGILQGNIKEGQIQVICDQHAPEFDYCGGELFFTAESVEVFDESGKSYSMKALDELCEGYWASLRDER